LVQQAEQAVAGVKDADLRKVAFEKILDVLLTGPPSGDESDAEQVSPAKSRKKKTKSHKPLDGTKSAAKPRGPKGYLEELISDSFFDKQKTITDVKIELGNRGHHFPLQQLSTPLMRLCSGKQLRRHKSQVNGKESFVYSNW
jgi:hypothetical protein